MYWLGKCPPWNGNETFWCPLKWESSQNISYWGRENASVQGQNKTAQPAAFDSSCIFTAPKKCGPGEPRHLLQFSASWWRPNPAPVDGPCPSHGKHGLLTTRQGRCWCSSAQPCFVCHNRHRLGDPDGPHGPGAKGSQNTCQVWATASLWLLASSAAEWGKLVGN